MGGLLFLIKERSSILRAVSSSINTFALLIFFRFSLSTFSMVKTFSTVALVVNLICGLTQVYRHAEQTAAMDTIPRKAMKMKH